MTTIKSHDGERPVKLEWLRSLLAVADLGSFTKAAKQLRLSQPAVSTHIKELEANTGSKLFELAGGHVKLSRAGESAAREARKVMEGVRAFRDAVAESESVVQGTLRLGASTTPGNYLLLPVMGRFETLYPAATTTLFIGNSSEVLDRLVSNGVDLALLGLPPRGELFVHRPFAQDELVLFVSAAHRLAGKRNLKPSDLAGERILRREADSATRSLGDAWFAAHRLHPVTMELAGPEAVKRAAAAGLGIGLLSRHAIEWELEEKRLALLPMTGFPIRRPLYLAYLRRKHHSPAMKSFLALLEASRAPVR